jgi:gamma-glutamyltranspeptidase/glutathione hydrolase
MQLGDLLRPAISAAEEGFAVGAALGQQWDQFGALRIPSDADASATYTVGGRFPTVGDVLRQPRLARTLRTIAEDGSSAFYRGALGKALAASIGAKGGLLSTDDLAMYEAEWVQPIHGAFRDLEVVVPPPNSIGVALLEQLGIVDALRLELSGQLSAETIHLQVEAAKWALRDAVERIADPTCTTCAGEMTSPKLAGLRAGEIRGTAGARSGVAFAGSDTTYVAAVDANGNVVSLMNSLRNPFGSGVVARKHRRPFTQPRERFLVESEKIELHCAAAAYATYPLAVPHPVRGSPALCDWLRGWRSTNAGSPAGADASSLLWGRPTSGD